MIRRNFVFAMMLIVTLLFSTVTYADILIDDENIILPFGHAYIKNGYPDINNASSYDLLVGGKGDECSRSYVFFNIDNFSEKNKYILKITPKKVSGEKTISVSGYKYPDAAPASLVKEANISTEQLGSFSAKAGLTYEVDVSDFIKNNITVRKNIAFLIIGDDNETAEFEVSKESCGIVLQKELFNKKDNPYEPIDIEALLSDDSNQEEAVNDDGNDKPAADDLNAIRASQTKVRQWPEIADYPDYVDIDDYTTTYYKPWLLNYHFTEPVQVERDYKGGEGGQRLNAGAISPFSNNKLLVGYDTEGIYRSDDGGVTWHPSQDGIKTSAIVSIEYDPDDDNIVYCMTARVDNGVSKDVGIFKSKDGGRTWYQVHNMKSHYGYFNNLITFSEKKENGLRTVYAGTLADGPVLCSYDGGETWSEIGLDGYMITRLQYVDNALVATTDNGIFVTSDDGKNWEKRVNGLKGTPIDVNNPELGSTYYVYSFAFDPDNHSNWYCGLGTELYVSYDRGMNWQYITDTSKMQCIPNIRFFGLKFGAKKPDGCRRFFATLHGQYSYQYSDDYGKTWHRGNIHNEVAYTEDNWGSGPQPVLVSYDNPDLMWVMLQDENYKSTNGGTDVWPSASGCSGRRIMDYWVNPENPDEMIFGTTDYGMAFTMPTGRGEDFPLVTDYPSEDRFWIRYNGARSVNGVAVDPRNRNRVLICVGHWSSGVIKESLDGGLHFRAIADSAGYNGFLQFNKNNPDIIYSFYRISYDNGKTWTPTPYRILGIDPNNNDILYSMTSTDGTLKSVDCGRTWKKIAPGFLGSRSITVDPRRERLYVGTEGTGIAIVEDGEVRLKTPADGLGKSELGSFQFYYVVQNPNNPDHLVTCGQDQMSYGHSAGIYESFDAGETWHHVEGLVGTGDTWFMFWHPYKNQVFISTSNGTFVYLPDKYYNMEKNVYRDVKSVDDSYALEQIESLYKSGITNQFTDGNFKPKQAVRRHELLSCLYNIIGIDNKTFNQVYDDVSQFSRYYVMSMSLFEQGIIDMSASGELSPYEEITGGEILKDIVRVLRTNDLYPENDADFPKGSFENAVHICTYVGILPKGFAITEDGKMTREDTAVILYNLAKKLN